MSYHRYIHGRGGYEIAKAVQEGRLSSRWVWIYVGVVAVTTGLVLGVAWIVAS